MEETKNYIITATAIIADVVEAQSREQAEMLFRARYPEMSNKNSKILNVSEKSSKEIL